MKEQISLVLKVHELDEKIRSYRAALDKIGPELEEQEALVREHRLSLTQLLAKIADTESKKATAEKDSFAIDSKLKQLQGKLSQIQNNREYQAALKEIAESKKRIKELEDQILKFMAELDVVQGDKKRTEEDLEASLKVLESRRTDLSAEEGRLKDFIQQVEDEKKTFETQIEPRTLAMYQKMVKSGRSGISEVKQGTCGGCRMKIPPQLSIEILKAKEIHVCPSCYRILYVAEWLS